MFIHYIRELSHDIPIKLKYNLYIGNFKFFEVLYYLQVKKTCYNKSFSRFIRRLRTFQELFTRQSNLMCTPKVRLFIQAEILGFF